jgi:hypothetical protein
MICEHNKMRNMCKECKGASICPHNRERYSCKECKGSQICVHNKRRQMCADCNGTSICKSKNEPYNTLCRTYGNRRLDGFCAHCFVNLFPDDPRTLTIYTKSKELKVVSHILNKCEGFIHDKTFSVDLQGGCCATKRRIDKEN